MSNKPLAGNLNGVKYICASGAHISGADNRYFHE